MKRFLRYVLVALTLIVGANPVTIWAMSANGREIAVNEEPRVATLQVYSRHGDLVKSLSFPADGAQRQFNPSSANAEGISMQEATRKIRSAFNQLRSTLEKRASTGTKSNSKAKPAALPALEASLAMMDAISAGDRAKIREAMDAAAVRIERKQSADGNNETRVFVRGVVRLSLTQPSPNLRPVQGPMESGPFVDENRAFQCDEDPDDPCATQEDRDAWLALAAEAMDAGDELSSALDSDYTACLSDGSCDGYAPADSVVEFPAGSGPWTADAPFGWGCSDAYRNAALGIGWGIAGVGGFIATVASPEPVSKLWVFTAGVNAIAGIHAAVWGVQSAIACHYAPAKLYWDDAAELTAPHLG
jgi:hypothetical protein